MQNSDLIDVTGSVLERVWREHRHDEREMHLYDNIYDLRKEINNDNYWYLTRQVSADANTERIHTHVIVVIMFKNAKPYTTLCFCRQDNKRNKLLVGLRKMGGKQRCAYC